MAIESIWKCASCKGEVLTPVGQEPLDKCGHLNTDMTRFPDDSWVRIETWHIHDPGFVFVESREMNPAADILAELAAEADAQHLTRAQAPMFDDVDPES